MATVTPAISLKTAMTTIHRLGRQQLRFVEIEKDKTKIPGGGVGLCVPITMPRLAMCRSTRAISDGQ
jgi:hypothetical protein